MTCVVCRRVDDDSLFADVLALAAAIGELTVHTRRARTAQWCALQMSSNDMPAECKRLIDSATSSNSPKQRLLAALQAREDAAAAAVAMMTSSPSLVAALVPSASQRSPLVAAATSGDANNNMK